MSENGTVTADAVREIERIAREAQAGTAEIRPWAAPDGELYVRGELRRVSPKPDPAPGALALTTLQGLADFVNADADKAFTSGRERFVVIDSPTSVSYCTGAFGSEKKRHVLAVAQAVVPDLSACVRPLADAANPRVQWSDPETFIISAAALFTDNDARKALLALLSAIKWEQTQEVADDGVTMVYSTRAGIVVGETTTGEKTLARNPWVLAAFRTFAGEVDQPEARFILRTRGGAASKQVALFEVGDGMWRTGAVSRIKSFLETALQSSGVKVYG